jgi:aminopeptidase-like protein
VNISKLVVKADDVGTEMYELIAELYPICRSITGDGFRETLRRLQKHIPINVHEVPSGTQVFDWTVPREWNIRDAYVKNARGERVIDFQKSNLHVLNYSVPIAAKMSLSELKPHLFTLPEHPDWIPYRTSYYQEAWGFCLSHNDFLNLPDGEYEVCIDSSLPQGHLTYGECYLEGESDDEVLISCHACHPSLCNDNLSGVALATLLAKQLGSLALRYSYRFLFIPGTIGSITWLCLNESQVDKIKHGLVLACVGDAGNINYKKSRRGNAEIDRAMQHVLEHSGQAHTISEFIPYGYDERQYCSPGFNLPVGCLMRSMYGQFPEYHTSADDLNFVQPRYLADSFEKCISALDILENNQSYMNQNPKGEPQLGRRGLYGAMGGRQDREVKELALLWVLNLSDGEHSLLDIAERAGLKFGTIKDAAEALLRRDLLKPTKV